jgi:hypothetical protein
VKFNALFECLFILLIKSFLRLKGFGLIKTTTKKRMYLRGIIESQSIAQLLRYSEIP